MSLIPGDIVVINGLKSKSEWNNKKAIILQYVSDKDRYAVKIVFYHNNRNETALLQEKHLTFVSKQRYIKTNEGKITSKTIQQDINSNDIDDIDTEFTWKIPKKQLLIYNKLSKDCSYFSPIFEYKGMLFIFELIPNGYCRVNINSISSYKMENGQLLVGPPDNEGYVSLILTCLSMPFNTNQIELDYSIQINSIPQSFRSYIQIFHNDKRQSIWQRMISTNLLKTLKKIKVIATFKSFSKKINNDMNKIINRNNLLHFSWNFNAKSLENTKTCKQHRIQDITRSVFQHDNEWKWAFKLVRVRDDEDIEHNKLTLELVKYPDYIQSVHIIALIKCSQLNIGGLICHTYDINDGYLAAVSSFCNTSYLINHMDNMNNMTFEIILNITECIYINGHNAISIESKSNVYHLVITNWIRKNRKCDNFVDELKRIIINYLIVQQEIIDKMMNFENDDRLKCISYGYNNPIKCINVKFLENDDLTPFRNIGFGKMQYVQNYYLVTFEDCTTSNKPLYQRKRGSQIIWACNTKENKIILMVEMGQPDMAFMTNTLSTDCIQYQLNRRADWKKIPLTISYFCKNDRNFKDVFKMYWNTRYMFENKRENGQFKIEKSKETEPEKPIRFRAWNAHIMQYEDFDVTARLQNDDYWDVVDKQLLGLYLKIRANKMFEKR